MNAVSVDVDMLEHLPAKTMLKLIEQAQKLKRHQEQFQQTVKKRPSLFRRLEEMDIDVRFSMDDGDINLSFTGDGEKFGTVWGELRRAGWSPNQRPEKDSKKSEFYTHWNHGDGLCRFWMHFTSAICKRVQVGTKTIEQPIYEIQCESLPDLIEDSGSTNVVTTEFSDDIPF